MIDNEYLQYKNSSFSIKARLKSFVYAWNGILQFFKKEHNAQLHLATTFFVVALSVFLKINSTEVMLIALAVGFVWVTEMINTAIEKAMDFITTETHSQIKWIKDVAAGAVLISSMVALIIGAIIFLPKILMR